MWKSIILALWKRYLPKMLALRSPSVIPRSGEKAKLVNAFVIYIFKKDSDPLYLLDRIEEGSIIARKWNDYSQKFEEEVRLKYEDIINLNPEIIHYHGLDEIRFYSMEEYFIEGASRLVYAKAILYRFKNWFTKYRFARKDLLVHKRIDVLRKIIDCHVKATNLQHSISANELFTLMHTPLWYIHPNAKMYKKTLQLNLDSLVITGELRKEQDRYFVTGKAIETITHYELEENRYDQQLASQKLMGWLTFAILFLTVLTTFGALVQAHIIEVPTLIDFRHKE